MIKPSGRSGFAGFAIVPFFACMALATALWFYASMREEYSTVVEVPLEMRLPEYRVLESSLMPFIRARVQGAGWQLLNLALSGEARCAVFVSDKSLPQSEAKVTVTRSMLSQGMQVPTGIHVVNILTDPFTAQIGVIERKKVPIVPVLNVDLREGFMLSGRPAVFPDSVTLRSSRRTLASISLWKTQPIVLSDVYAPVSVQTRLSDTLAGIVDVPSVTVTTALNVQQMAELVLHDVRVVLTSAPTSHRVVISPTFVTLTLRGGIHQIAALSAADVTVSVDYSTALGNTTGSLVPKITVPADITVLSIAPARLRCVQRFGSVPQP